MKPSVVFVGAGPVGLMAAIQLKLYHPELPILMREKYQEYQRGHLLYLNQSSFKGTHPNPDFQEMLKQFPQRIRTNELEAALLDFSKKLGIEIEYAAVNDCKKLAKEYPDAKVIVGADGSHSVVHESIFGHQYQIHKPLKYIAEVKYEVKGKALPLNTFTEMLPAETYTNHLVSEYVGREKNERTPVSLRIFINEETYKKMINATFKNPFKLSEKDKIESSLYYTINNWLTARAELAGEHRLENSEKITVTNLPVYASKEFVTNRYSKTWFLVGDAAFGVPYYRALNNGILCSSQLAKTIDAMLNHCQLEEESFTSSLAKKIEPTEYYSKYMKSLVNKEDWVASIKNTGVTSLEYTAAVSRSIPVSRASLMKTREGRHLKTIMRDEKEEKTSSDYTSYSMFSKTPHKKDEPADKEYKTMCTIL